MNFTAVAAVVALLTGFASAWQIQSKTIALLELKHANERIEQQRAARTVADRFAGQVLAAQNKATARTAVVRRDAVTAGNAGSGLRIASTDTVRASTASLDACTAALGTHSQLLTESIEFIREVSADADQWVSHAVMLQDAWQKP